MNIQEFPQVREAINAVSLLKKEWKLTTLSCLIDVAFLFILGFISGLIFEPINQKLEAIWTLAFPKMQQGYALLKILFFEDVISHTKDLVLFLLALIILVYFAYVLFQGTNWWVSCRISGRKIAWKKYFIYFSKINLLWFGFLIVYNVLDVINSLWMKFLSQSTQETPIWSSILLDIFLILIIYTAIISYSAKSFKLASKSKTILTFLSIIIIFLVLQFILTNIESLDSTLGLITGIILLFPAIVWSRIYLNLLVK